MRLLLKIPLLIHDLRNGIVVYHCGEKRMAGFLNDIFMIIFVSSDTDELLVAENASHCNNCSTSSSCYCEVLTGDYLCKCQPGFGYDNNGCTGRLLPKYCTCFYKYSKPIFQVIAL